MSHNCIKDIATYVDTQKMTLYFLIIGTIQKMKCQGPYLICNNDRIAGSQYCHDHICAGMTKLGRQCKKKAYKNGYCNLHTHNHQHTEVVDVDNSNMQECSICYEKTVKETDSLDCKHYVCKGCILQMRDVRCPMCRKNLSGKLITEATLSILRSRKYKDTQDRLDALTQAYIQSIDNIQQTYN
jgi:hypothetical protein